MNTQHDQHVNNFKRTRRVRVQRAAVRIQRALVLLGDAETILESIGLEHDAEELCTESEELIDIMDGLAFSHGLDIDKIHQIAEGRRYRQEVSHA